MHQPRSSPAQVTGVFWSKATASVVWFGVILNCLLTTSLFLILVSMLSQGVLFPIFLWGRGLSVIFCDCSNPTEWMGVPHWLQIYHSPAPLSQRWMLIWPSDLPGQVLIYLRPDSSPLSLSRMSPLTDRDSCLSRSEPYQLCPGVNSFHQSGLFCFLFFYFQSFPKALPFSHRHSQTPEHQFQSGHTHWKSKSQHLGEVSLTKFMLFPHFSKQRNQ